MGGASAEKRIPLAVAKPVALELIREIAPFCETVLGAGSIRRGLATVGDIDIVATPKTESRWKGALFPEPVNVLFEDWGGNPQRQSMPIRWVKPNEKAGELVSGDDTEPPVPVMLKPDAKLWRGLVTTESGIVIGVDFFLVPKNELGLTHFIRTGSKEWNQAVMVHANRVGFKVKDNHLWRGQKRIATPTEREVFEALGIQYVEPKDRKGESDIRALAAGVANGKAGR